MSCTGGLPKSIPIHDIAIQQRENEIVLGTHGRSLYVAKLDDIQALVKDPELRKKKQAEVDKIIAAATFEKDLFKERE